MLVSFYGSVARAQTWDEIFSQKKTQIKYLNAQIVALQLYAGYVKKGYEIASGGVNLVKSLKGGEYGLHDAFYASLKTINPQIRNDSRITAIMKLQNGINQDLLGIDNSPVLTAEEISYIDAVSSGLRRACEYDQAELLLVTTSGNLVMNDDQRLGRIAAIHLRMREKSAFTQVFRAEVQQLIAERSGELQDLENSKLMYGLTF